MSYVDIEFGKARNEMLRAIEALRLEVAPSIADSIHDKFVAVLAARLRSVAPPDDDFGAQRLNCGCLLLIRELERCGQNHNYDYFAAIGDAERATAVAPAAEPSEALTVDEERVTFPYELLCSECYGPERHTPQCSKRLRHRSQPVAVAPATKDCGCVEGSYCQTCWVPVAVAPASDQGDAPNEKPNQGTQRSATTMAGEPPYTGTGNAGIDTVGFLASRRLGTDSGVVAETAERERKQELLDFARRVWEEANIVRKDAFVATWAGNLLPASHIAALAAPAPADGYVYRKEEPKPVVYNGCSDPWHRQIFPVADTQFVRCPTCRGGWKWFTAIE